MPNFIPVQGLDAMVHELSLTPFTTFTRTDLGVKKNINYKHALTMIVTYVGAHLIVQLRPVVSVADLSKRFVSTQMTFFMNGLYNFQLVFLLFNDHASSGVV